MTIALIERGGASRGSHGDAEIAESVAGPGFVLRESERSSPGSTFVMNGVSAGGIGVHPAEEPAGRGRPDTAWSRRVWLSTPALARGSGGRRCGCATHRALLVLAAVDNLRSPLTPGAGAACYNACRNSALRQQHPAGTAPAATAAPPPPGCGRAAHHAFLAGSRRSSIHTAARLGAMEAGRAGRGKVPTQRRRARRHGSWPRRTRRSSQRITARLSAVEVCCAGLGKVRTQGADERDGGG